MKRYERHIYDEFNKTILICDINIKVSSNK